MAKLLINDCYPGVANSLRDFFVALGLSVQTVDKAEEIVGIAQESKPNILIVDIRINNEKRWDIIENVKKVSPNTKIIIMSTYNEPEILNELKAHNIKTYMSKPIDMEKLLSIVKEEIGEI